MVAPLAIVAGVQAGATLLGAGADFFSNRSQSRRVRAQIQQQLRISRQVQAQQRQLGNTEIRNVMGLNLSNRLSSALQLSGSNAESLAQDRRNLEFTLANRLYQFDIEQFNIRSQSSSFSASQRLQNYSSLLGVSVGAAQAASSFSGFFQGKRSGFSELTSSNLGGLGQNLFSTELGNM